MRWLILGAGYTGAALAQALAGEDVTLVRRTAVADPRALAVDLADPAVTAASRDAIVVHLAPPPAIPHVPDARRLVYLSSTGVYAPGGGAWVDEGCPLAPTTTAGRARLAHETAMRAHVILRAPGIYGPGRGVAARLRAGTMRIVGDGSTHVSRIHVDDLAAALVLAATLPDGVYNVADRDPCTLAEHADGVAARLGLPPPPRVPAESVDADTRGMLLADRKIDARHLESFGWAPRYPSWRDAPD